MFYTPEHLIAASRPWVAALIIDYSNGVWVARRSDLADTDPGKWEIPASCPLEGVPDVAALWDNLFIDYNVRPFVTSLIDSTVIAPGRVANVYNARVIQVPEVNRFQHTEWLLIDRITDMPLYEDWAMGSYEVVADHFVRLDPRLVRV